MFSRPSVSTWPGKLQGIFALAMQVRESAAKTSEVGYDVVKFDITVRVDGVEMPTFRAGTRASVAGPINSGCLFAVLDKPIIVTSRNGMQKSQAGVRSGWFVFQVSLRSCSCG